ncbi:MAG: hypothetical protein ACRCW2_08775, partial [Cellulosilyticaceae bacterium]
MKKLGWILGGMIAILLVMWRVSGIESMPKQQEVLEIQYFYNNPCGSCDGEASFYEIFNQEVGDLKEQVDYHMTSYNTFKEEDLKFF